MCWEMEENILGWRHSYSKFLIACLVVVTSDPLAGVLNVPDSMIFASDMPRPSTSLVVLGRCNSVRRILSLVGQIIEIKPRIYQRFRIISWFIQPCLESLIGEWSKSPVCPSDATLSQHFFSLGNSRGYWVWDFRKWIDSRLVGFNYVFWTNI